MDGGTYHLKASKYRNCHYLGNYDVPILKCRFLDSIKLKLPRIKKFFISTLFQKQWSDSHAKCRSSHWRCSIKKLFLKISQYSQENTCVGGGRRRPGRRPATLIKETPTEPFSCEYCEISQNSFFYRTPEVAASRRLS